MKGRDKNAEREREREDAFVFAWIAGMVTEALLLKHSRG